MLCRMMFSVPSFLPHPACLLMAPMRRARCAAMRHISVARHNQGLCIWMARLCHPDRIQASNAIRTTGYRYP
ncbi:hypothetical protein F4779DRAFT_564923 [Xylariaceae sp. FL0662B]|nr:hypothetical protein F4779DRAFT_564923 [Xylariaceae sp. FL0662B]